MTLPLLQPHEGPIPGRHYLALAHETVTWGRLPAEGAAPVAESAPARRSPWTPSRTRASWKTGYEVPTDVGYAYLSAAADFVVSQVVDDVKGVHRLIHKGDFGAWT